MVEPFQVRQFVGVTAKRHGRPSAVENAVNVQEQDFHFSPSRWAKDGVFALPLGMMSPTS
jgi:hypothetical protein